MTRLVTVLRRRIVLADSPGEPVVRKTRAVSRPGSATPMTVVTCFEASQVGNAIIAITNHWVGSLKKLPSASRLKSAKVSAMALH